MKGARQSLARVGACAFVAFLIASVCWGCGGSDGAASAPARQREQAGGTSSSGNGYPNGRDWEMTNSRNEYLRNYGGNMQWGDYAYFDVYCSVRLLRDRKYADSELVNIATRVASYARQRDITNVVVSFLPPQSGGIGGSAVAQVVWAPDGDSSEHASLGDYSKHRFRVVWNYARTQKASEANPYGL